MKAVVVGGGFAGLAAGFRLRQAHWEVVLLEQSSIVGGRVTSTRKSGYLLENGATQISTGYAAYLALVDAVGLRSEVVECSNVIGLLRRGKLYEIDGQRPWLAVFSGALGLGSKLKMARAILDFLALNPPINVLDVSASHRLDKESAEDYCLRRLNPEIYDVLVDAALRCYVLNRGDQVSVLEWFAFLRNLAGQKMLALRNGLGSLPQALSAQLDVRLDSAATAVRRHAQGVQVTYRDSAGSEQTLAADGCVIATQLPDVAALAPELAGAIEPLSASLTYNRTVLVHLGFSKQTLSRAIGVLVGTAEHPQIGLVWLEHNKLAEAAPPNHSLFTVYFEERGLDSVQPGSNECFVEIAVEFVTKLFPELVGQCDFTNVGRWQRAVPNPAPGVYRAMHEMKSRLDPASRIQLAGDYFTCTGQNSAIYWGNVAADNLLRMAA